MRGRVVTIWDGIQYRQVSPEEADRLVKKDMAQAMPVGGTEMKFRKDFTGYYTREQRPAAVQPPQPELKVVKTEKEPEPKKPAAKKPAKKKTAAKKPQTKKK